MRLQQWSTYCHVNHIAFGDQNLKQLAAKVFGKLTKEGAWDKAVKEGITDETLKKTLQVHNAFLRKLILHDVWLSHGKGQEPQRLWQVFDYCALAKGKVMFLKRLGPPSSLNADLGFTNHANLVHLRRRIPTKLAKGLVAFYGPAAQTKEARLIRNCCGGGTSGSSQSSPANRWVSF